MRQGDPWGKNLRVLDLPPQASWEEVQARYRRLALAHHPDVNPSKQSSERFRRIAMAYQELAALERAQRRRSAEELARMSEDPKVQGLPLKEVEMRLLYSASRELRAAAAYLLGSRGEQESRWTLRQAARDPEVRVRWAAMEALARIGRPGDLLAFVPALFDRRAKTGLIYCRAAVRIWLRALKGIWPHEPKRSVGSFAWEEQR
jgi:curved DNA-binding protein CbpA